MASRRKKKEERKLTEKDISGLEYFHKLDGLLSQLHEVGCDRDRAGNRILHMDQYCMLVLLYLFNPIGSSLRGVQQASELKKVQKKLGCIRASLGSLSESVNVFDADRLKPIIACMLISLWTGRKPTLRTYEMICWYFCGMADDKELLSHINRLKKHQV